MNIKSLALSSLSLTFVSSFLFPVSSQATDDCDIFLNAACQIEVVDGYMRLTGKFGDPTPSITLGTPQSVVEFRLVAPSAAQLSEWYLDRQAANVYCFVDDETRFSVAHSTDQGVSSEVFFQGKSQTVTSSITPHGDHSLVVVSFEVPQTASLSPYSCSASISQSFDGFTGAGDSYVFTLSLNRTFTPSSPTPSTPTPQASTRSTPTPSTPTPSASSSPRGTSSPSPLASAESTDVEAEVEIRSSDAVVDGNADSETEPSQIGFFLAVVLAALAGIGVTVAFFQRKAILKALAKFKKIAKP